MTYCDSCVTMHLYSDETGNKDMKEFVDYVMSFYGDGGLYDMKATREEVWNALAIRLDTIDFSFDGDSLDRERVRDIIIKERS